MIEQHRVVWDRVQREHGKEVARLRERLSWTDRDILVMASIVEKEAVVDTERPRIAQVFINRLTSPAFKPKRLETDPTIRYGCMVPGRRSRTAARSGTRPSASAAPSSTTPTTRTTPTSTRACRPGRSAARARSRSWPPSTPDGSDYFYFVAKDDRSHVFAKTVAEHERNVDRYAR